MFEVNLTFLNFRNSFLKMYVLGFKFLYAVLYIGTYLLYNTDEYIYISIYIPDCLLMEKFARWVKNFPC